MDIGINPADSLIARAVNNMHYLHCRKLLPIVGSVFIGRHCSRPPCTLSAGYLHEIWRIVAARRMDMCSQFCTHFASHVGGRT